MAKSLSRRFVIAALAFGIFSDMWSQSNCNRNYEEGKVANLWCSTSTSQSFNKFGPVVEMDGKFEQLSYCDSNGNCHNEDPKRYVATYTYNSSTSMKKVSLKIISVHRKMTKFLCYSNGSPLFGLGSNLHVYLQPSKPICIGPEFVDGDTAAIFACTSERVYPGGQCVLSMTTTLRQFDQYHLVSTSNNLTSSETYPGDFQLACQVRIQVTGILENTFELETLFYPKTQGRIDTATAADPLPPLKLKAPALYNPGDNNRTKLIDPEAEEFTINILVISNPPPKSFSLSMRRDETSEFVTVAEHHYSVKYTKVEKRNLYATIAVTVTVPSTMSTDRTSYFSFTAENGVIKEEDFEYVFTVKRQDDHIRYCGYYEEGQSRRFSCSISMQTFDKLSPHIEINNRFEELGYCDSDGNCSEIDSSKYTATYSYDPITTDKIAKIYINKLNRNMTRIRCFVNDLPLYAVGCSIAIYVQPLTPTCTGPEFIDGDTAVLITCTSERVFPAVQCEAAIKVGSRQHDVENLLSYTTNLTSSDKYPGDFNFTCTIRLQLFEIHTNIYRIYVSFHPFVAGRSMPIASQANSLSLDLRGSALYHPAINRFTKPFDPDAEELTIKILVISNPPPNRFSLSVRHDETSEFVNVSSQHYSIKYTKQADNDFTGTIELTVAVAEFMGKEQNGSFTFRAENGIVPHTEFLYEFTAVRQDDFIRYCGSYEEGTSQALVCTTTTRNFDKYGPQVEMGGDFKELGYCNSEGECFSDNPDLYTAAYFYDSLKGERSISLHIKEISRNMTRIRCYMNGQPFYKPTAECKLGIYVKPSKPICTSPRFVDEDTSILITCISERVYPAAECEAIVRIFGEPFVQEHLISYSTNLTSSENYPDDYKFVCQIKMQLTGILENKYRITMVFHPLLADFQLSMVSSSTSIPSLDLKATSLLNPNDNNSTVAFNPDAEQLNLSISVVSNPAPNQFSLFVRHDETSDFASLPSDDFYVRYTKIATSNTLGTIELTVKIAEFMEEEEIGFFMLTADNGVVGKNDFQYFFEAGRRDLSPTTTSCKAPTFTDNGEKATVTCTSDRIFREGICGFKSLTEQVSFTGQPTISKTTKDSIIYPGSKLVTCQFLFPVAGNRPGDYQIEVEIISVTTTGNYSVSSITPPLSLRAMTLHDATEINQDYLYPDSGNLEVAIPVRGNPAPNQVTLLVRTSQTPNSVPVSSQNFQWTFERTVGSETGTIKLSITGGVESGAINTYTLKAENGVVGQSEFEFIFTVQDIPSPTPPRCENPVFVDDGATALLTCVADRVYQNGSCGFELMTQGLRLNREPFVSTRNAGSTVYPGYNKVTCQLQILVDGNQAGDYQFIVQVTPGNNDGLLMVQNLTSVLTLSPIKIHNATSINRLYVYPDSGNLEVAIPVRGNPAPNQVTLLVRTSQTSNNVPVSSENFQWTFERTVGSETGTIKLSITGGVESGAINTYTLKAENGVVRQSEFEFTFTVRDIPAPTTLNCENPVFVNEGAAARIVCTSDRVYQNGACNFEFMTAGLSLNTQPVMSTVNDNSTVYPGYKKVTCTLDMPVSGNSAGEYQFRIDVTPGNNDRSLTVGTLTPVIQLTPITTYNMPSNNPQFTYPDSGPLIVDVQVRGNPAPNQVTLLVRTSQTSNTVPVSSQNFQWAFERTVGSETGTIKLSITGGVESGAINTYTLKADNGVVGLSEFEFTFTVRDIPAPTTLDCETPVFVNEGAAARIACTSDRVYQNGACNFEFITAGLSLNTQPVMSTVNDDSTVYPGYKKVNCTLEIPVAGNSAGDYQFRIDVTPGNNDRSLTVGTLTPVIQLTPITTYNMPSNNPQFTYPDSGPLIVDVQVRGNPAPNQVTLLVRTSQTSNSVPVSSENFQWTFERTVGSETGTIKLSITGGVESGAINTYNLKAENGVVGQTEFEFTFTVRDIPAPTTLDCENPVFVNEGAVARIACTSDRVYQNGACNFEFMTAGLTLNTQPVMSTVNDDSTVYPGYKKVNCTLEIPVAGNSAGDYQFRIDVTPGNNDRSLTVGTLTPVIQLTPITTYNMPSNNPQFTYPDSGPLIVDVQVRGNPAPNQVTLLVRTSQTSNTVPVSSENFQWTFERTVGSETGTIKLSITGGVESGAINTYTLKAENGVVGLSEFEFTFTVRDIPAPTTLDCENPVFVNEGAAARIACTSDRVYQNGACNFEFITAGLSLNTQPVMSTVNDDSTVYPGYKKVTCTLEIPVAGNSAGDYQFRIDVTPGNNDRSLTVGTLTPVIQLSPITTYNMPSNNPQFTYPDSGPLIVDVQVRGNPAPNQVTLLVRTSQTSNSVPVSSENFQWTFERTVGSETGTIKLSITGGVESGAINTYTLKAENGVVGLSEFEFTFTVRDIPAPTTLDCENPVFVNEGAAARIACTSDRVYQNGACNFEFITAGLSLNTQPVMSTVNDDSTVYPGYKKVTCTLEIPVAGNSAGDYQFRIDVTPGNNDRSLTVGTLTPVIQLSPITTYNMPSNNPQFTYPDSGPLIVDVQVRGNPAPNQVTLLVRTSQTSNSVPVSSENFQWTFERTVGSETGTIKLSITGGVESGAINTYTLKAENGVDGQTEFAFTFIVRDIREPTQPICEEAVFINGSDVACIACISDRVYQNGSCSFEFVSQGLSLKNQPVTSMEHEDSTTYPGYKILTCKLQVSVTGNSAGDYKFNVQVTSVSNDGPVVVEALAPTLTLSPIAIDNATNNIRQFFYSDSGPLEVNVQIKSNPAPTQVELSVTNSQTSNSVLVSSENYDWTFDSITGSELGTLTLSITGGVEPDAINTYTLSAGNGIVGQAEFEFTFTVQDMPFPKPTPPNCEAPEFVDGSSTALISCISDRVYQLGSCEFELVSEGLSFTRQPLTSTINEDSKTYPSYQKVTCQLRLSVAGNAEGNYRLKVQVTPGSNDRSLMVETLVPSLRLSSLQLYDPQDTSHQFLYPDSGGLTIDIHVKGTPDPNRITLWVTKGENSNTLPVSSKYFQWSFERTVGSDAGIVQLSITGGVESGVLSSYILKAENGVVGENEFQYLFSVHDVPFPPIQPICNTPMFPNGGASAVVVCVSDRVYSQGTCNFTLTTDNLGLNAQPVISTRNDDSLEHPGYKKVTCQLQVQVAGTQPGDYRFLIQVTSAYNNQPLNTQATVPSLILNPIALYDTSENDHEFQNPESGELAIDVHVTGNPDPNRVTLWVRKGETSNSIPVSSRDFRWTFERTVGTKAGIIHVSITGGLQPEEISYYILKAENGVVGDTEMQYRFTLKASNAPVPAQAHSSDNNVPTIAGATVGGLIVVIVIVVIISIILIRKRRATKSEYGSSSTTGTSTTRQGSMVSAFDDPELPGVGYFVPVHPTPSGSSIPGRPTQSNIFLPDPENVNREASSVHSDSGSHSIYDTVIPRDVQVQDSRPISSNSRHDYEEPPMFSVA